MSADASSASDWLKQILSQIDLGSDASLGRSFWARCPNVMHFAGKPVVSSRNVGCFLRLEFERLLPIFVDPSSASCSRLFFFAKSSPKFHISKEEGVAIKVPWIMHWSCLYYLSKLCHRKTQTANSVIQPGLWTKTPHVSKFTICFSSSTIRLLPMSKALPNLW